MSVVEDRSLEKKNKLNYINLPCNICAAMRPWNDKIIAVDNEYEQINCLWAQTSVRHVVKQK